LHVLWPLQDLCRLGWWSSVSCTRFLSQWFTDLPRILLRMLRVLRVLRKARLVVLGRRLGILSRWWACELLWLLGRNLRLLLRGFLRLGTHRCLHLLQTHHLPARGLCSRWLRGWGRPLWSHSPQSSVNLHIRDCLGLSVFLISGPCGLLGRLRICRGSCRCLMDGLLARKTKLLFIDGA
jgi:hypothetical protein